MPAPLPTQAELEYRVKKVCLLNGVYDCDQLDPLIDAAIQERDDAVISSSSALGHSSTVSIDAAANKVNSLLAAKALCLAKKAESEETDSTAATIDAARQYGDPMARGFNFNNRCIE